VEAAPQVLAPLDPEMATLVAKEMRKHGIALHLGVSAKDVTPESVVLSDETVLEAELVIMAIGVRPDTGLAKAAGLTIGTRGGIEVDDFNRTSNHDIYAVGDAAEKTDAIDGSATLVALWQITSQVGQLVQLRLLVLQL
jgi:NADPH-dependent 2,4-dienoyl-CoA reductase/sulfur reductase-like enzyme